MTRRELVPAVILVTVGIAITARAIALDILAPLGELKAVQVVGRSGVFEARKYLEFTRLPSINTFTLVCPAG